MAARNPESVINFAPGPAKIPAEVGGYNIKFCFVIFSYAYCTGTQESSRWNPQH